MGERERGGGTFSDARLRDSLRRGKERDGLPEEGYHFRLHVSAKLMICQIIRQTSICILLPLSLFLSCSYIPLATGNRR